MRTPGRSHQSPRLWAAREVSDENKAHRVMGSASQRSSGVKAILWWEAKERRYGEKARVLCPVSRHFSGHSSTRSFSPYIISTVVTVVTTTFNGRAGLRTKVSRVRRWQVQLGVAQCDSQIIAVCAAMSSCAYPGKEYRAGHCPLGI